MELQMFRMNNLIPYIPYNRIPANDGSSGDSYQRLRDNQSGSSLLIQVLSIVAGIHWSMLYNLTRNMQSHEKLIALRTQYC